MSCCFKRWLQNSPKAKNKWGHVSPETGVLVGLLLLWQNTLSKKLKEKIAWTQFQSVQSTVTWLHCFWAEVRQSLMVARKEKSENKTSSSSLARPPNASSSELNVFNRVFIPDEIKILLRQSLFNSTTCWSPSLSKGTFFGTLRLQLLTNSWS